MKIDGGDLNARRSAENPGRKITLTRGKRDFPRGQEFTVVVTNRDGVASKPITFVR
ncbi:MAG TPA: hypothetical protein VLU47_14570 [Blastocatellia bacterium]|nr:hypothetical protein [Blastocatellia bacterium]